MKNGELNGGGTDERRCPICGKRCQNKSALAVHLFWKHRNIKPGESDQVTEIDNERPKVDETKNTVEEDKKMSTEVVSFLKSDLDKLRADVERLGSEVSKISRIVSRPDGTYYCIGDTCVKIESLHQGLQDVQKRLERFEKEFENGRKTSIGELLKRDPQARTYIKSLAQQIVVSMLQNSQPKLDEKTLEERVKRILESQKSNEAQDKGDGQPKDRFYELFLSGRGR